MWYLCGGPSSSGQWLIPELVRGREIAATRADRSGLTGHQPPAQCDNTWPCPALIHTSYPRITPSPEWFRFSFQYIAYCYCLSHMSERLWFFLFQIVFTAMAARDTEAAVRVDGELDNTQCQCTYSVQSPPPLPSPTLPGTVRLSEYLFIK